MVSLSAIVISISTAARVQMTFVEECNMSPRFLYHSSYQPTTTVERSSHIEHKKWGNSFDFSRKNLGFEGKGKTTLLRLKLMIKAAHENILFGLKIAQRSINFRQKRKISTLFTNSFTNFSSTTFIPIKGQYSMKSDGMEGCWIGPK